MLARKLPLGEGIFSSSHTDKTWAATRKYIAPFFSLPNLRWVTSCACQHEAALLAPLHGAARI